MLSNDEAELYDRQIRLWGAHAQAKIRDSSVLMLGFNGVASEVAKTLVLAGIKSLTIVDDQPIQEADDTSNLFCRRAVETKDEPKYRTYAVKEKLKRLNPLVKVIIINKPIISEEIVLDETTIYNLLTLHSFLSISEINQINTWCRKRSMMFYFAIDFGFYGFIFNDLSAEFAFEYEKYNKKPIDESKKDSKAETKGDLISIDDDEQGEEDTTDDDNRPKKRLRVHSPDRPKDDKKADAQEKVSISAKLPYVTFNDMISAKNLALDSKSSPVLLVSIAMIKFFDQCKRLPRRDDDSIDQKDLETLKELFSATCEAYKAPEKLLKRLSHDWTDHVTSSMSPVCAVIGGLAGQDIIRVLSGKDIPIYNTFAFDGLSINGSVTKVGFPEEIKVDIQKPVIRDLVEIDED